MCDGISRVVYRQRYLGTLSSNGLHTHTRSAHTQPAKIYLRNTANSGKKTLSTFSALIVCGRLRSHTFTSNRQQQPTHDKKTRPHAVCKSVNGEIVIACKQWPTERKHTHIQTDVYNFGVCLDSFSIERHTEICTEHNVLVRVRCRFTRPTPYTHNNMYISSIVYATRTWRFHHVEAQLRDNAIIHIQINMSARTKNPNNNWRR